MQHRAYDVRLEESPELDAVVNGCRMHGQTCEGRSIRRNMIMMPHNGQAVGARAHLSLTGSPASSGPAPAESGGNAAGGG